MRARPSRPSSSSSTASQEPDGYGRLQMELEWLKKSHSCSDTRELRKLVDHDHPGLSVIRQCALLGLPRSTLYYQPTPVRESSLRIMARIDLLSLDDPCSGSRRMVGYLAREAIPISRDRVRNLTRRMGLGTGLTESHFIPLLWLSVRPSRAFGLCHAPPPSGQRGSIGNRCSAAG